MSTPLVTWTDVRMECGYNGVAQQAFSSLTPESAWCPFHQRIERTMTSALSQRRNAR